jgi:hypothetical protein
MKFTLSDLIASCTLGISMGGAVGYYKMNILFISIFFIIMIVITGLYLSNKIIKQIF